MITEQRPRSILLAGVLGVVLGACSDSNAGAGGAPSGGTGGQMASSAAGRSAVGDSGHSSSGEKSTGGGTAGLLTSGGTGNGNVGGTGNVGTGNAGGTSNAGESSRAGTANATSQGGAAATAGMNAGATAGGTAGRAEVAGAGGVTTEHGGAGQAGAGRGGSASGGRGAAGGGQGGSGGRSISFGTLLDASAVMSSAQELAQSLANPNSSQWRAKGDQHRKYHFAQANADEPFRIYVPTNWDGSAKLPLAMFLHGSGSDENSYLDQNNKQMLTLAQQHGYLLVSPLGASGAYGNFLRLTAPFGDEAGAADLMAQVTSDTERTNELSEEDVINVLELVLSEYPIDRASMFLFGHSMGSGGTWYIGGKYAGYWRSLAPMSGPFVQKTGYPWDAVRALALFVTEGTQAPSIDASRLLRDWLSQNGFHAQYEEVNADHGGMIPLVLPDIFDFFDASRTN